MKNKLAILLMLACIGCSTPSSTPKERERTTQIFLGKQRCIKCGSGFEVYGREKEEIKPTIDKCPNCPMSEEEFKQLIDQMKDE